jgi:MoxR-like ATPase
MEQSNRENKLPMERVLYEVKKIIVGQDHLLERLIVALLARGHILVEGVPGLAKTMAIKTLADSIGGEFKRIQFTPDLVPADLIGTRIYNQKTRRVQYLAWDLCSRIYCLPMKSTARPPRCKAPCSK